MLSFTQSKDALQLSFEAHYFTLGWNETCPFLKKSGSGNSAGTPKRSNRSGYFCQLFLLNL
jgi:hypothetical protein